MRIQKRKRQNLKKTPPTKKLSEDFARTHWIKPTSLQALLVPSRSTRSNPRSSHKSDPANQARGPHWFLQLACDRDQATQAHQAQKPHWTHNFPRLGTTQQHLFETNRERESDYLFLYFIYNNFCWRICTISNQYIKIFIIQFFQSKFIDSKFAACRLEFKSLVRLLPFCNDAPLTVLKPNEISINSNWEQFNLLKSKILPIIYLIHS